MAGLPGSRGVALERSTSSPSRGLSQKEPLSVTVAGNPGQTQSPSSQEPWCMGTGWGKSRKKENHEKGVTLVAPSNVTFCAFWLYVVQHVRMGPEASQLVMT